MQTTQPSKGQGYHVGDGETIALGIPSGTAHARSSGRASTSHGEGHVRYPHGGYPSYPQRFLFLVLLIRVFLRSLLSRCLNSHYRHFSPPAALSAFAPLLLSRYFPSTFCPWFFSPFVRLTSQARAGITLHSSMARFISLLPGPHIRVKLLQTKFWMESYIQQTRDISCDAVKTCKLCLSLKPWCPAL